MKNFILATMMLTAGTAFAAPKTCTMEQIQTLFSAEGPKSEDVKELLMLEVPQFICKVETENFFFPSVCNTFVFTELRYKVSIAGRKITATVHDGKISCTNTRRTVLESATIK